MSKKDWSDVELCEAARNGDSEAESVMLERYQPLAQRAARISTIPGYDYDDLLSFANLAILRAVRKPGVVKASFGTLARTCVHNALASVARAQRCRVRLVQLRNTGSLGGDDSRGDEMIRDPRALEGFEHVYTNLMIRKLRAALTESEGFVLDKLLARGGLSCKAGDDQDMAVIAAQMGISRASVWRVIMEIRRKASEVMAVDDRNQSELLAA